MSGWNGRGISRRLALRQLTTTAAAGTLCVSKVRSERELERWVYASFNLLVPEQALLQLLVGALCALAFFTSTLCQAITMGRSSRRVFEGT